MSSREVRTGEETYEREEIHLGLEKKEKKEEREREREGERLIAGQGVVFEKSNLGENVMRMVDPGIALH